MTRTIRGLAVTVALTTSALALAACGSSGGSETATENVGVPVAVLADGTGTGNGSVAIDAPAGTAADELDLIATCSGSGSVRVIIGTYKKTVTCSANDEAPAQRISIDGSVPKAVKVEAPAGTPWRINLAVGA